MSHIFNPKEPGSYSIHGSTSPKKRIVMLHGVGGCASEFNEEAQYFAKHYPDCEIVCINGIKEMPYEIFKDVVSEEEFNARPGCFSWVAPEQKLKPATERIAEILEERQKVAPCPTALFGFSQGGFVAMEVANKRPELLKSVFLHSSGIVYYEKSDAVKDKTLPKPRINTLISIDGPYIRHPLIFMLMIPRHFWNSLKYTLNGYKSETTITNGFGHNINEKSRRIATKKLDKAFQ